MTRTFGASSWPLCLLGALLLPALARAQAMVPAQGAGSWIAAYVANSNHYHVDYSGRLIDIGHTHTEALYLGLDYGLTDRLALSVSLPFIKKRHRSTLPFHDAIDDGRFHGRWQDWGLGLRWQWLDAPFVLTPHISFNVPSDDYEWHGHAAVGLGQKRLEVGASFARPFDDERWYVAGTYGYSISEEWLGIGLRASRLNMELGHHLASRWTFRALLSAYKAHNGLRLNPSSELWASRDRISYNRYLDLGLGFGFQIDERHRLFGHWLTWVDGKGGHATHNNVVLGLARSF